MKEAASDAFDKLQAILKEAGARKGGLRSSTVAELSALAPETNESGLSPMLAVFMGDSQSPALKRPAEFDNSDNQSVSSRSTASSLLSAATTVFVPRKDCMHWLKGHCWHGDRCTFKHDPQKRGAGVGGSHGPSEGPQDRPAPKKASGAAANPATPAARSRGKTNAAELVASAASKNPFAMLQEEEEDD